MLKVEVTLRWLPSVSAGIVNQLLDLTVGGVPSSVELGSEDSSYVFVTDGNTQVDVAIKAYNGLLYSPAAVLSVVTPDLTLPEPVTELTHEFKVIEVEDVPVE